MTMLMPNQSLQRTRLERRGCNRGVPRAGSLSSYECCQVRVQAVRRFNPFFAARSAASFSDFTWRGLKPG